MSNEILEEITFFNTIYRRSLSEIDNKKIEQEAQKIKSIDKGEIFSNIGGWQSNNVLPHYEEYDIPETKELLQETFSSVAEIYELWEIEKNTTLLNFWYNINGKKDFNIPHSHPGCIFSACYYVKTPKNSGKIVFQRPDNQELFFTTNKVNPYTIKEISISPNPGDLIIFPSYINHYVEPNLSDEERYSIAFNFV